MTEADDLQDRLTAIAAEMAAKFGPAETAGVLAGAAAAVLISAVGRDCAADFLRGVADGVKGEIDFACEGGA